MLNCVNYFQQYTKDGINALDLALQMDLGEIYLLLA